MTVSSHLSLSVIIVNWNTRESLLQCIGALSDGGIPDSMEIVLVDNGSSDGSVEAVRSSFPQVRVVANDLNRGFAGGANDGVLASTGRTIVVLNPDIIAAPGDLLALQKYLDEHNDVGAVMPLLLNENGMTQDDYIRRLPTLAQIILFNTEVCRLARRSERLKQAFLQYPIRSTSEPFAVEQIAGAFLLTRRSLWEKIGGMDEAYRLFFEDVDWSFRVSTLGLRLMVYPGVRVKHTGGRSFTPDQECWIAARYSISMVVFFRRYRGLFRALLVAAVILVNAGAVIVANLVFRPFVRPSVRNTLCRHAAMQASIVKHFYRRWVRNEELELPSK